MSCIRCCKGGAELEGDAVSDVSSLTSEQGEQLSRDENFRIYQFGRGQKSTSGASFTDTKKEIRAAIEGDHLTRSNRKDLLLITLAKLFADMPCGAELSELSRTDSSALKYIIPLVINTLLYGFGREAHDTRSSAPADDTTTSLGVADAFQISPVEQQLEDWLFSECLRSVYFALTASWYLSSSLLLGPTTLHHRTMTLLLGMEAVVTMNKQPAGEIFRKSTLRAEAGVPLNASDGATIAATGIDGNNISVQFDGLNDQEEREVKEWNVLRSERNNVFHAELDFVKCLTDISYQLFNLPREQKKEALRGELEKLNSYIPASAFLPSFSTPHRILHLCSEEAFPFSTKERTPYMLVVEVLLLDQTPNAHASERKKSAKHAVQPGSAAVYAEPNHPEQAFSFKPNLGDSTVHHVATEDEELLAQTGDPDVLKAFGEPWKDKVDRIRSKSSFGDSPNWRLVSVIVKARDQLRQEMFAARLIKFHYNVFTRARIPVWLYPYEIAAVSADSGFIEAVVDSNSIDSIKKNTPGFTTLKDYFLRKYGASDTTRYKRAVRNFVESMAGYSVVSYVLQLKDRHNGNILLDSNGHVIHIDFGFLLSNSPGGNREFEKAPFKLTNEMIELMGGQQSSYFKIFRKLCCKAYNEVCKERNKLLLLVDLMMQGNLSKMPCFVRGREYVLHSLSDRLSPGMSSSERKRFFNNLIDAAAGNITTQGYDLYQKFFTGIH